MKKLSELRGGVLPPMCVTLTLKGLETPLIPRTNVAFGGRK